MGRVLVTGAAGFLGSHLVEHLIAQGHVVVGIDNYATGNAENLAGVIDRMDRLINATVCDGLDELEADRFDTIYHMAGHVGVGHILEDPLRMLEDHVNDAQAVCEAALRSDAVLLVASSSEVYGDSPAIPYREDAVLHVGPSSEARSGYAVSKLCLEHFALAYHRQRSLKAIIARLFNVAGPRQRAEGGCVVPRLVTAALRDEPLIVHGDGKQRRCFSHVADVVIALSKLVDTAAAVGQVVNVGQSEPITIYQAATDVGWAVVNHDSHACFEINGVPFSDLDAAAGWARMQMRIPDVTKLTALLGEQAIPNRWPDIVRETVAYWRERLAREEKAA